jgi:hypothetical protein
MQVNIYKYPVTDHGKISKKGLMTLELDDTGKHVTKTEGTGDPAKVGNIVINDECLW